MENNRKPPMPGPYYPPLSVGLVGDVQHDAYAAMLAAQQAQADAESAKDDAETAQGKAEDAQEAAETAKGLAEDAQEAAETAQGKAEDAQEAAEDAAEEISESAAQIETNKEDIADLKSAFVNSNPFNLTLWEQGALTGAGGEITPTSTKVRTPDFISIDSVYSVYAPLNWAVEAFGYTTNNVTGYLGKTTLIFKTSGARTKSRTDIISALSSYPEFKYIKLVTYNKDETQITPTDVATAGIKATLLIDISNELNGKVPTTIKVNGKALSSDVNLYGSDIPVNASDSSKIDTNLISAKQIIIDNIGTRYVDFEQGTLDASGQPSDNVNFVRTRDFIPVKEFLNHVKPIGIGYTLCFYDTEKNFIPASEVSASPNIAVDLNYIALRESFPINAVYVKSKVRLYSGGTGLETSVPQILASDYTITVAKNTAKSLYDGYIDLSGVTLTENAKYQIQYSGGVKYHPMLVTIRAKYTGETQPTMTFIRSWIGSDGYLHTYYSSAKHTIGGVDYVENTFRVAPFFVGSTNLTIDIQVAEGTTLTIDHLYNHYDDVKTLTDCGVNLNGHGSYGCGCPINTMAGFEMAARMGYKYCITIPKVTSDEVLVCLHDDNSIQATARNDDGTQIANEYRDHPVSYFTYLQLLQFDFGIYRGKPFAGERIPKLEDFFALCAKTGMHPMLSVHPNLNGYWSDIKELAEKYNVLKTLNIKSDHVSIEYPMTVLLDDIESYTIDDSESIDRVNKMLQLISTYSIDTTKCRCGVEYINTITDALISNALSNGLFVGYYGYGQDEGYVKTLIKKGVTEFTDDYIASVGLNW